VSDIAASPSSPVPASATGSPPDSAVTEPAPSNAPSAGDQPAGTDLPAVVDLLGLLAYAELMAFDTMAADARLAPDLRRRAMLSAMAAREVDNYRRLESRLTQLGAAPEQAMRPYVSALADYHRQTEPDGWLEALTKAYVGEGIADDFYREVAGYLGEPDRSLILDVLHDSTYSDFAADEIRSAIAHDPRVANRLSMWARRLVGEALSQAQRLAGERVELMTLILSGTGDQAGVTTLFRRLTAAHTARMSAVNLNN
jgi:hypothetical protein